MSIGKLKKYKNTEIVLGTASIAAVAAVPAKPGYYTTATTLTTTLQYVEPIQSDNIVDEYVEFNGADGLTWRVATYEEIETQIKNRYPDPSKCLIAELILTAVMTTPTLFESVWRINSLTYLGIARQGYGTAGDVGVCFITRPSSGAIPKELKVINPVYNEWDPWVFDEQYTCAEINGVEVLTKI